MRLAYVFDPYCGWSYGFSLTMEAFAERHPDIEVETVVGGLFLDENRPRLGDLAYVPAANAHLARLTGAPFGEGYQATLEDGSLVLDSGLAGAGFAALRAQAPARAVAVAGAVMRAFFEEGRSLNEAATFRGLAARLGLDPARTPDPLDGHAAAADVARAWRLGVRAFPTVLAEGAPPRVLARGYAPLDVLESRFSDLPQR